MSHATPYPKELVVLVADLDMENALRGILGRHRALRIRQLAEGENFDILRHPQRDPGCRGDADTFLQGFLKTHRYALVVFDHHGCGRKSRAADIESDVEQRLAKTGWCRRCAAVVIEPELEAWVWSDSPEVARILGWRAQNPSLRSWLERQQLLRPNTPKPEDPKAAMERVLRQTRKPASSRMFSALADSVGLTRCRDRAFNKLKTALQAWFPLP